MSILLIFLIPSVSLGFSCNEMFWGSNTYRDQNELGQIVEKTDIFRVREWSEQSQFDTLLVEKNREMLLNKSAIKNVKVIIDGEQITYYLKDWEKNPDFYQVMGLDLKQTFSSQVTTQDMHNRTLSIALDGNLCQKSIAVRLHEKE